MKPEHTDAEDGVAARQEAARCLCCGGETTPCYLVVNVDAHVHQCHGMQKKALGSSVHTSPISARVCVECGFVMVFARKPGVFRAELRRANGELPLPTEPGTDQSVLPLPGPNAELPDAPSRVDAGSRSP